MIMNEDDKKASPNSSVPRFGLFDGIRTMLLIAVAIIVALFEPELSFSRIEWGIAVGGIAGLVIAAQILRAWMIAKSRSLAGLHELFAYLIATLLTGAALLYLDQTGPFAQSLDLRLSETTEVGIDTLAMGIAASIFLFSFTPLIVAVMRIEHRTQKARRRPILRDDVVSVPTLVITSLILGSIFALAWAAGSGRFQLGQQINVLTMTVVVGGFLAVIFVPNMVRAWNDWAERSSVTGAPVVVNGAAAMPLAALNASARLVSYVDSILVRLFAPLSGATQSGFMVPHVLVVLVIVPLSAMGFILAAPYGLVPIGLAALIALALGRRWAWVEEDRETASRLQSTDPMKTDIKIGFANDLKDEALLGYASLFVLVPLALYQIQGAAGLFETTDASTGNPLIDWLSFFGAELAKAVPFVDWWEIYNVDVEVPFEAIAGSGGEWARHLTFAARAIVDLVIMAALLQAMTIWQRSRTQKRLFKTGELNAFDPFTEEDFFERGMYRPQGSTTMRPKKSFERSIEAHVEARNRLDLDALPYSRDRLSELIKSPNPDLKFGAEWMIKTYDVLAGDCKTQLKQLAQRWNQPHYRSLFQSSDPLTRVQLRAQKRELERILDNLVQAPHQFRDDEIGYLLNLLRRAHGHPEFAYAQGLAIDLLATQATGKSASALGSMIVKETWPNEIRMPLRQKFAVHLGLPPNLYLGQGKMRVEVLRALKAQHDIGRGVRAQSMIITLLEGASQHDGAAATRSEAKSLLISLGDAATE